MDTYTTTTTDSVLDHPRGRGTIQLYQQYDVRETAAASTSTNPLAGLPSFAALQAWVHRPQAVARCFVADVMNLRAVAHNDGNNISQCSRDVFLLDHFPCRVVELVAWVAGVQHKESTIIVTLDEGNGWCVLDAIVRLPKLDIAPPRKTRSGDRPSGGRETFRSASQRRRARLAADASTTTTEPVHVYVRPDIRIGDTVRVMGQVHEWARGGRDLIRQLTVDEGAGTGFIRVVDPDEEHEHIAEVRALHRKVYSRPFEMPQAAPTPGPSPSRSVLSSVASDVGDDDDDDDDVIGPDLPDPAVLPASRLTDSTFKRYVLDHMTRETIRGMRRAGPRRPSQSLSFSLSILQAERISTLAVLFPEYDQATKPASVLAIGSRANNASNQATAAATSQPPTSQPPKIVDKDATPRATFRSKEERERMSSRQPEVDNTPVARTFRSRAERAARAAESSQLPETAASVPNGGELALTPFTLTRLLEVRALRDLAARIVDVRARTEEKERRRRKKLGTSTPRDAQLVADRRARGLDEGAYKLSTCERMRKMTHLVQWAIITAHTEGGVVQVQVTEPGARSGVDGYLPLPRELLAPLLVPVVAGLKVRQRGTFRSRLERAAAASSSSSSTSSTSTASRSGRGGGSGGVNATNVTAALRAWGADGRWERVGEWAVEAALEWGVAQVILEL